MAIRNIEINYKNSSSYDVLYPKTIGNNVQMNSGNTLEQDINNIYTDDVFEVGDILCTCKSNVGSKWLLCDGSSLSDESTYSDLLPFLSLDASQSKQLPSFSCPYNISGSDNSKFIGKIDNYYILMYASSGETRYCLWTDLYKNGTWYTFSSPNQSYKINNVGKIGNYYFLGSYYSTSLTSGPWTYVGTTRAIVKTTNYYVYFSSDTTINYATNLGGSFSTLTISNSLKNTIYAAHYDNWLFCVGHTSSGTSTQYFFVNLSTGEKTSQASLNGVTAVRYYSPFDKMLVYEAGSYRYFCLFWEDRDASDFYMSLVRVVKNTTTATIIKAYQVLSAMWGTNINGYNSTSGANYSVASVGGYVINMTNGSIVQQNNNSSFYDFTLNRFVDMKISGQNTFVTLYGLKILPNLSGRSSSITDEKYYIKALL